MKLQKLSCFFLSRSLLYVAQMKGWKQFNQSHSLLQNNMQDNA